METTLDQIAQHLQSHYGIVGNLSALPGEHDDNFLVQTQNGHLVVRVVAADQDEERDRFILAVLAALDGSGIVCPTVLATVNGPVSPVLRDNSGNLRRSWVTTFVPGRPWGELLDQPHVAVSVGRSLAQLDRWLAEAVVPPTSGDTPWNLIRPEGTLALVDGVPLGVDRARIQAYLTELTETVLPQLQDVQGYPIHNDANPDNVLIQADGAAGFIDFGDAVCAPRAVELAVTATYLADIGEAASPDSPLTSLIRGYCSVLPLTPLELSCLPGLMRGRLALALGNALARAHRDPERADYVLRHAGRARRRMDALDALDQGRALRMWESAGVGS